jgi:hypothetical protein
MSSASGQDSESHQGPPPERQSGAQMNDPPASGTGTNDTSNKEQDQANQKALDVHIPSPEWTWLSKDKLTCL